MLISKHHKKTGLRTKVVRSIEELSAHDWKKVFPDVLESYDFFATLDKSNIRQFDFYYILVYERNTPVSATTCFMMNYSLDSSINGPLRRISNSIKTVMPGIFSVKAFICGVPIARGHIGISGDKDRVMHTILRRIEQIAKKTRSPIIAFKDFDKSYLSILDSLKDKGYYKFDSLPTTELNIRFKNFEEYLNILSSINRYDLRRKFKKVDGKVEIDFEVRDSLEGSMLDDVYRLYLDIIREHDMSFELLPIEFFRDISKNMPGRTKFFLWKIDAKLVGFVFCLVSEDTIIDYYVGLDYSIAYKYHLYFVKFRDILNWCIENKIKIYDMGITGYEPKRRLGFNFVPLYLYVKLRNRMMRPVFNLICQFLKFENFDPSLKKAMQRVSE